VDLLSVSTGSLPCGHQQAMKRCDRPRLPTGPITTRGGDHHKYVLGDPESCLSKARDNIRGYVARVHGRRGRSGGGRLWNCRTQRSTSGEIGPLHGSAGSLPFIIGPRQAG
jgi:hypothetical protein